MFRRVCPRARVIHRVIREGRQRGAWELLLSAAKLRGSRRACSSGYGAVGRLSVLAFRGENVCEFCDSRRRTGFKELLHLLIRHVVTGSICGSKMCTICVISKSPSLDNALSQKVPERSMIHFRKQHGEISNGVSNNFKKDCRIQYRQNTGFCK